MNGRRLSTGLALAFVSGMAALAHELLWTRRLVDVLGASAETFSKVVGAFFLGLALGAWIASAAKSSRFANFAGVAIAETIVAALAVPVMFSPSWTEPLFLHASLAPWLKWLLPLFLVAPPAIAMGLVLPWLLAAFSRVKPRDANFAVWIYAANTVGGICGIGAVLLSPVPALGLTRFGLIVSGLNLLVAGAAAVLHFQARSGRRHSFGTPSVSEEPADVSIGRGIYPLAFASGFLVLALEVLFQHQLAQVTINSTFSSGTVLGLVLLGLAASAAVAPALAGRFGERTALTGALLAAAALCAAQPFLLTMMRSNLAILPYELKALPYTFEVLKLGAVAVCPVIIAGGLIFPLLLRAGARGGRRSVGRLLAWNGVGGWLGAEFTQNVLAPRFGLWTSAGILAAVYFVLWAIHEWRLATETSTGFPARWKVACGSALATLLTLSLWSGRQLPQVTVLPNERLAAVRVGREGVVATVECGPGDWRMLFNNSYTLGGSKAQFNQERQGLLPLLLHGKPESVATLGVATGGTAAGVALHPGVERIDAIELSPLVLRFAGQFFSPYNRSLFQDRRVNFIPEDARWVIARNRKAYDVVVGDLFLPWRTGEGRLFTLEHFLNVRNSLKDGGLYCQWLPLFQLTRSQFDGIVRTFREVFPDAFLVRGDFYCDLPIVGLVGGRKFDGLDWPGIESGCERLRATKQVSDALVRHSEGVAMLLLGPAPEPDSGPINTLANAWLEWDAGRNILGLGTPWFIGVPCAEYVRDVQRAGKPLLPPESRDAQESGQFFLTLEVAARLGLPVKAELESQMTQRLPKSLREDAAADWRQWPSRVKPR